MSTGLMVLVSTAACLHCDQACHDTGRGATWVHWHGGYKCRDVNGTPLATWCEPSTTDSREAAEQKAFEEGVADCQEGHDALEEGAYEEGAAEATADLCDKVRVRIGRYRGGLDLLTASGKSVDAALEYVLEVLPK